MSNTVISVENISKQYHLGTIGTGTFRDDLKLWWAKARNKPNPLALVDEVDHGNREKDILWALKDISFKVEQGETLGIIGRNGAGKSTLLKILSRVTTPTSGEVKVKGRIASLLEVGTGFHPELTGRENIFLNGAIMGMSRAEVMRKFDEIVDFSGVEKFIDTPVKRYSSGMYVRLAFAVAAHLEPEILIVDEVLAVGDAEFQKKSLGKMGEVAHEGRTVLFVSHNMGSIRHLCKNGIYLEKGSVFKASDIETTINSYMNTNSIRSGRIIDHGLLISNRMFVKNITVNNNESDEISITHQERKIQLVIEIDVVDNIKMTLESHLFDALGNLIGTFCPGHFNSNQIYNLKKGNAKIVSEIVLPELTQGEFYFDFYLTNPSIEGLWNCPNGLKINFESRNRTTYGTPLEYKSGNGMIIIEGINRIE